MKLFLCLFLIFCGVMENTAKHQNDPQVDKLPVTLYYEALCPYCMKFVTEQLGLSMLNQDRLPFTELSLVPYGNAKKSATGNITCQHGVDECELNAWHACILEHQDTTNALKLISCMMRSRKNKLDVCAKRFNIDVTAVKDCKKSRSVDEILKKYGEETAKTKFEGVPAIAIDNIYDADKQEDIADNFDTVFCNEYTTKFNKILDNCSLTASTKNIYTYVINHLSVYNKKQCLKDDK